MYISDLWAIIENISIRKIPWRRKWQPTPVFLPGRSHGKRSLAGYSPWGHKRVGHDSNLLLFSHQVVSDSLQPHGLQHARPPCPSLSPRVCSNSCSLSWWCYLTISSCRPLLLLLLIFPSIRVLSKELALRIRWTKYWSFSFSITPSNEYSGLISFRIDWFDLLAIQGTLKSLLKQHSSKASILQGSAFFMVQLSYLYMTTRKTKALTYRLNNNNYHYSVSVQSLSCVQLFTTPWTTVCQASLSITNSRSSPKPMSIVSTMPSNHLILCHPLLLLPSVFPSIRVFSNESALHIRLPKYWSFSFNISPFNEHPMTDLL